MHSLTICFGPTGTVWVALFKDAEKAQSVHDSVGGTGAPGSALLSLTDDFGQQLSIRADQIHGMLLDDMDQSLMAQVERGLHQARAQAKAQDRAMADPAIKESLRRQQMGPAVMSPVPGGRFNG